VAARGTFVVSNAVKSENASEQGDAAWFFSKNGSLGCELVLFCRNNN
jgi:hypothetical protein